MDSGTLKTAALAWLRYVKKMDFVCTEGGRWSADVLGVNDNYSIEVEVKVSVADLKREFTTKQTKHFYYNNGLQFAPAYFYFAVPPEIAEKALEIVQEHCPKAGLLVLTFPGLWGQGFTVSKKAQRLNKAKPTEAFKRAVMLRMGSEVCGLHLALEKLKKKSVELEDVRSLRDAVIETLIQVMGPGPWEFEDGTTETTNS
jgi:hypothetical protein